MKEENCHEGTLPSSKGIAVDPALEWSFYNENGVLAIALHYPDFGARALIERRSNVSTSDVARLVDDFLDPKKKPGEIALGLAHAILALTPHDLSTSEPFQAFAATCIAVPRQRTMARLPTAITAALNADYQGHIRAFSAVNQSGLHAISVHYANWPGKRVIWQLPFDTAEDALAAADFHNGELGWSRKQADAIVGSACPEGVSVERVDRAPDPENGSC